MLLNRVLKHPDLQALLLLAALTLLLMLPAATMQGVYFYGDANDYFARLAYSAGRFRAGELPLWNPYLSMGGTHAGDPAGLTWYPPALLLFQILPSAVAYNYTFLLHVFLAAAGMYLLARSWQQSRGGALAAAMVYGFGGFLVAHLQHLNIVIGVTWLPWILLCLEKFFTTRRAFYLGFGALALGLQILGGHTQTVLYGACAWGAYCAVWLIRGWRAGERKPVGQQVLGLGLMLVGALGVAAIFLAPFLELLNFIARSERITYEFATSFSLEPVRLIEFVYPYVLGGNPGSVEHGAGSLIEMTAYAGIMPLVLSVFAVTRREWRVYFLVGLGAVALLLALGKYTPLYLLVYRLPVFGSVRAPARFLELVVLALALLTGFGLDTLRRTGSRRLTVALLAGLGAVLLALGALVLAPRAGVQLSETFARAAVNRAVIVSGGFLLGAAVLLVLWTRRLVPERVLVGLTLLLIFVDLLFFGASFRYNYVAPFAVYDIPGKSARVLQRDRNQFNTYYWGLGETKLATYLQGGDNAGYAIASRAGIRQSLPLQFKIHSMQGYGSEPPAYTELVQRIEASGTFDERAAQWLAKYGAQAVLSPTKLKLPALQLVERNAGVSLFRLSPGAERAALFSNAVRATDPMDALRVLEAGALNENTVVLEAPVVESYAPTAGTVTMERDEPEYVSLAVQSPEAPAYLVLNDTFYPGWRALVDGQPAPIYRANGLVRAVPVPAGTHRVEFVYDPLSVKIGTLLSGATLLALMSVMAFDYRRARTH